MPTEILPYTAHEVVKADNERLAQAAHIAVSKAGPEPDRQWRYLHWLKWHEQVARDVELAVRRVN